MVLVSGILPVVDYPLTKCGDLSRLGEAVHVSSLVVEISKYLNSILFFLERAVVVAVGSMVTDVRVVKHCSETHTASLQTVDRKSTANYLYTSLT